MIRILIGVTVLAASVCACSSADPGTEPTTNKDSGADIGTEAGGDTGSTPADTGTAPADTGPTDPDEACPGAGSAQDCFKCCAENHMDGYNTFTKAIKTCLCTDSTCNSKCGDNYCAGKNGTADCQTCANGVVNGSCQKQIQTDCTGDCLDFNKCANACPKS